jgi:hypothetical protein
LLVSTLSKLLQNYKRPAYPRQHAYTVGAVLSDRDGKEVTVLDWPKEIGGNECILGYHRCAQRGCDSPPNKRQCKKVANTTTACGTPESELEAPTNPAATAAKTGASVSVRFVNAPAAWTVAA